MIEAGCVRFRKNKLFLEIGYTSTKTDPPFCMWHPVGKVRPPGHGGVLLAASPSLCWAFCVVFALLLSEIKTQFVLFVGIYY